MEQEGDGNKKPQDQRLKEMQVNEQVQPQPVPQQPQQPQKCPRCESMNTKFCYYNNYSLSQPRYFCKTCRRYWTQGGTLRNVPVGGGCRKGKRAKNSSSSAENSSRPQPQPPPQQEMVQTQPNLTTVMRPKDPSSPVAASVPSISPFYQGGGGGYLSSLAAIHGSLNPPHPFDQSLNVGDDSSNLGLLSGFNIAALASQRQIRPSQQFYQMGSGSREREVEPSLYSAEQGLISSSVANSQHDWPQGFINNANHTASDTYLWSTISTTSSIRGSSDRRNNANAAGSSSLIPNQWPDLPEYGPHP